MKQIFRQFANEYKGKPLQIYTNGVGTSLANLVLLPGNNPIWGMCIESLTVGTPFMTDIDCVEIEIYGNLTTTEYQAYTRANIIIDSDEYIIVFPTLLEEEFRSKGPITIEYIREWEDMIVALVILKILHPSLDWEVPENVTVERIEL
jgi:hypothetical protein